jgi:threonine dehydrogenase-like Zn-dependent dehydrogenase
LTGGVGPETLHSMRAALLDPSGNVSVREVAPPEPDGRALVRVAQAGVCGTDLKIVSGEVPVSRPRVLGHEMTGWVEAPGPRGAVPAGTPVLVNPALFCGRCDLCRRDLPHLCRSGALLGRDVDGVFAELVAVDEGCLHPLPDSLPAADAALLQVLSTCVHAQFGLRISPGDTAVVVGLGVSGLLHVQLLRDRGVQNIVAVTRSTWKRDLALSFGASATATPEQAEQVVADSSSGRGADIAIECAGTQPTLAQAMRLAGAGGVVVAFGTVVPDTPGCGPLPTYDWYLKELTILSPRAARPRDCDLAIQLCAEHRLDLAPLVTGRFPLEYASQALTAIRDPEQLKVVLDIG